MSHFNRFALIVAVVACLSLALIAPKPISASPFYYYFQEAPSPPAPVPEPEAGAAELTNQDNLKDAANRVQEHVGQISSSLSGNNNNNNQNAELPQRMKGHFSDLVSHGSSAVRGVVDTVQPDFSNIGKDLTDVYQATRSQVSKKIEPLANRLEQTVKPYIEQAGKAVAPYVNQAKEEVPKFLHSTREKLAGVFDKLKQAPPSALSGQNQQQTPAATSTANNVQQTVQQYLPSSVDNIKQQLPSMESIQNSAKSASESVTSSAQIGVEKAKEATSA